jgi:hypothetical protein
VQKRAASERAASEAVVAATRAHAHTRRERATKTHVCPLRHCAGSSTTSRHSAQSYPATLSGRTNSAWLKPMLSLCTRKGVAAGACAAAASHASRCGRRTRTRGRSSGVRGRRGRTGCGAAVRKLKHEVPRKQEGPAC